MSFVLNSAQQISLFDKLAFLSRRKQQMLEKSWAQTFSDHIFTRINEHIFAPLYSEKTNSRPNAPINVVVGALILKDFSGFNDEEITEACEFDFRYQYALHTTSFENQPVSERTLSRFRSRLAAYELTTGEDLLHQCFVDMAESLREYMEISPNIKRMDSMMIESNIRKMGRLELLYTCLSNLVKELHRDGRVELLEGLEHYADPNDRNRIVYHDQDTPQAERLQKVIDDAAALLPKCAEEHRGYSANITETVGKNGSLITNYQYDVNTRSDVDFLRESLDNEETSEERATLITDGAYASEELAEMAAEKNIELITTGLRGRKPREILTQFRLSEDGHSVTECPEGHTPKSSSYIRQTDSVRVSFPRCCCESCPHREACNAKIKVRTAVLILSLGALTHTQEAIRRKDDENMKLIGRIRNGVETIPSMLRRKYCVDTMPVRGKLKTKVFFSFKMLAVNLSKLWLHEQGLEKCRPLQAEMV